MNRWSQAITGGAFNCRACITFYI